MAATKKKETRDEIISRVAKEYNITPKEPNSKGTVIASSKGSQRTYKANRPAEEQKQVNQSIAQQQGNAYWAKKKQEGTYNYKWYAGAAPTASETMAQIFRQSSNDEGFFNKLNGLFDEETQNSGSVIYSPYRQATNYKAIEGLRALGVDVPDVVTSDWISSMQSIYASQARTTATGYNAAAPTKSSTVENDIAYWLESLEDAENRTGLAEQQVQSLYDEVKYWTERGYGDSEIAKRVKADFSAKYNVLDDMDSARTSHEAVRLNRAIDYNGDDTIYGMIWAARNNGGSGDYFQDAVHQRLGQGALYQRDPASEAARDPSSYESYDPYSQGGTLHELNRKYGVNAFSREWLEANRSMLADPEQAEDWRDIEADLERADTAAAELEKLNQLIEKQVQKGKDIDTITEMLNAVCTDGAWGSDKFPTLQKMEATRASGTYLNLAYGVDFTLPKAIARAQQMIDERDAAVETEKAAEPKSDDSLWDKFNRFLASIGIPGLGSYGEEIDGMLAAQKDAYDANTIGKNYASKVLGIEIYGDLTAQEQALVEQTVDSVETATKPRATAEEREAANVNIELLQGALTQAADDPNRQQQDSYKTKESWTSVAEQNEEEPREGMIEMVAEPTAYVEGMTTAQADYVDEQAALDAYAQMCQGGEWDSGIFDWAMAQSNNPDAIWAEIGQGIIDHRTQGAELTGLAKSWWSKFGGLVDNIGYPTDYSQINDYEAHPENYDSRRAYGTQVYGALEMNEEAYRAGAIGAQQYADNLIRISDIADGISGMTNGARATDEQADQYISHTGANAILEKVYDICKSGMDAQSKQEEATRQQIYAQNETLIRQMAAGEPITDEAAMWGIMSADTSEMRANDAAYKDALNYIDHELGAERIADSRINFTTGDANVDAAWGEEYVHNEGAMVYSQGVTALARAKLDANLQYAAACGLTLEEYYAKFPEFARTPRQIVGEARAEYNNAWCEFGGTLEALTKTNESFEGSDVETAAPEVAAKTGQDSLSFSETLALAVQKVDASNALDLEKTLYMMLYGWRDNAGRVDLLKGQYSNDRSAYAADLDTWEASREAKLRDTYENDITAKKAGTSYEDWRAENSDQQLEEIRALRESSRDIFDIGLSIDELNAQQQIVQKTGNTANVDKVIAEYGSKTDQEIYNATASLAQSAQMMLTTALLGGGMGGTLASTAANAGGKAYDRFEASGDYDTAMAASIGAWVVNAAIEKASFDRLMPESLGGAMEQKMLAARSMLAREGVLGMIKSPKSLSKAAQGVVSAALKNATGSVGEGIEELLQSLTDSVADNIVYGKSILPSAEQFSEAKEEGKAGFWMGAVMEVGSDLVFGIPKITDYAGNAISKAEAMLKPEHDGAILNSAIDFEASAMALANSQDALAKIEASSEYAQKQQAETELQAVEAEMIEAETAYTEAKSAQGAAVTALENANVEAQDADAFTEAMRKNMVAAAENLNATNERLEQAQADLSAAQAKQATAQQKLAAAQTIVQGMYNQTMDEAKAHYAQVVADKYFAGDSEAQRAASEKYLNACRELDAVKTLVRSTAPMNDGQSAHIDHGRALIAEDSAEAVVAEAKAQMDEAYAQTAEGKVGATQNAELQEAAEAAAQAADAAKAAPTDARKQLAAEAAQAQYAAVQAQQSLDNGRDGISARLQSPVPSEREQAVADWKELQNKASTATEHARQLTKLFNETDTQKDLRSAIENMRQYTNDDLIDTRSRNHEAASAAYAELQRAQAAVEIEQAWNDMLNGTQDVAAYQDAREKYDSAVDNQNRLNYTNNYKEANGNVGEGLYREDVRGASGAGGTGEGSGAAVRGSVTIRSSGNRRIAGWQNASRHSGGRRADGHLGYESTTGITEVSATPEAYVEALAAAKAARPEDGHQVSAHSVEDITEHGLRPYLTGDGLAGFAIEPNGNITGVFKNPESKRRDTMTDMMLTAIANGGDRLDCYAGDLFNTSASRDQRLGDLVSKYARYGFEPVAVVKYNPEYAESDKIQDIVFFMHNGKSIAEIQADIANKTYASYTPEQLLALKQFGPDDYDAAMAYRDSLIEQRKPDIQEWRDTGMGWGDHRTPGKTGETTTAEHNPIEILDELTRRIRVGYNPGGDMSVNNMRMPAGTQGFYNRLARSITTRTNSAGDLAVSLHEFGHAVQDRLSGLHATPQLIQALPQGVRNSYAPQELDGEAVAEFVVDYIFSRDEAIRQAGAQYVQDFEDMLRADRTLNDAIEYASTQTELWNNASTSSKIGATIRDGNDPERNRVGSWIQDTLRKVETAIADMTAPADLVSRDFRNTALYSMHASNRADMCISRFMIDPQGRNIGQSLAERIYRAGVKGQADIDEVCRFALARHALDRRNQNADVFSPEEFSTADLTAYIEETRNKRPSIVAGANALVSYWKDFMDAWWVETGMISRQDAREMREKYPNYVPTFRVVGKNFAQYGGRSSRFQIRGVTRGGSSLEVINPINSIVRMTQQMVSTVSHNQMMREFHSEMRHGGLGYIADDVTQEVRLQTNNITRMQEALEAINDTGVVDPDLMDDAYARLLELQQRWIGTGQNHGMNVVGGVNEMGTPFFYKVKDEGLFRLLSGTANSSGDMGAALRTIRNFKNLFTQLTTGKNPGFALKNAIRDFQASVATGTHSLTYADGMVRWVRAFYDVLTQSGAYPEWKAMGGGEHTRYSTGIDGSDARKATQEITDTLLRGKLTRRGRYATKSTALDKISNVFTLERLNTAIEDASRYVEYRFGRHDRSTPEGRQEAFMASQNVTTNFGTHGASRFIQIANNVVPFMNATIQGLNKDINLMRDLFSGLDRNNNDSARWRQAAPKLAKTMLNSMLTAMLQYGILKLAGGDDDDEDYALLSQEMRTGNLIIPIGKDVMELLGGIGFDRPYIRIPISQSPIARMLYSAGLDIAANVKDYSPLEVDMWRAVKSILGDSMVDGTVLQAIDDTRNNRTWYGGEIESEYMRNFSPENRYSNSTPQAIIELGAAIGVSPAKLEYLADQYSGFYGEIITPLISAGRLNGEYSLSESAENLIYSMLRGYTIDPVSSNDLNSSYSSAKTTISEIIADGKAGMAMNNLAYSADPEEAYSAAETLNAEFKALDKQIAALWNEYNEIKRSTLPDREKAAQMRAIRRDSIIPLQQEALALYEEYKMQYIDADTLALEIYGRLPGGLKRPIFD